MPGVSCICYLECKTLSIDLGVGKTGTQGAWEMGVLEQGARQAVKPGTFAGNSDILSYWSTNETKEFLSSINPTIK